MVSFNIIFSIVMEYMDDGDLYQKICDKKKKKNNYFD
jgi:hypothetical protein